MARCRGYGEPVSGPQATPRPAAGWQVRVAATVLTGMACGYLVAQAVGRREDAIQAAIVAGLTFAAGSRGRLATSVPVAAALGGIVVVFSTIGALTTGSPWLSAVAMAVVAFVTTVMTAAKPVGLLIGMVASYAYFLVTSVGVLAAEAIGRDLGQIGILGLIGFTVGLALVVIRASVEQLIGTAPTPTAPSTSPSLLAPMIASVRAFDHIAKDAVRRAIALGIAMFAFQSVADHDAFWVLLTVFVILQPNGRSTVRSAIIRVTGTFIGVMGVVIIAPYLPESFAIPIAVLCLAFSLAASMRSSTVSAAFGAAAASVLAGLPHDDIVGYAAARLLDTAIGAVLALTAGYLLWPRSRPTPDPVPGDLAGSASAAGISTT